MKGRKKGNISFALALAIMSTGVSLKDLTEAFEKQTPKFDEMVKAGKKVLFAKGKPTSNSKPGRPLDDSTLAGLKAMKVSVSKLPPEGSEDRKQILMRARNVGKAMLSPKVVQATA